MFQIVAIFKI